MTVISSLDLSRKLKPHTNRICKSCGLYLNQPPVFEKATFIDIFWVGLSAVQFDHNIEPLPLSSNTRSGALINEIEAPLSNKLHFYKTNLVKCLPLKDGKIRYPSNQEMEKCFPNFKYELETLKPSIVFLLGMQVSSFILKKEGINNFKLPEIFNYKIFEVNNILFIPVHHPSYILVYKRKSIKKYISSIQKVCIPLIDSIAV